MNTKEIAHELKDHIKQTFVNEPYQVLLYGSYARGNAVEASDLEILIIFNSPINWKLKDMIYDIVSTLNIKYDVWIDVSLISYDEMNTIRGRQPFIQNALKEGIEV